MLIDIKDRDKAIEMFGNLAQSAISQMVALGRVPGRGDGKLQLDLTPTLGMALGLQGMAVADGGAQRGDLYVVVERKHLERLRGVDKLTRCDQCVIGQHFSCTGDCACICPTAREKRAKATVGGEEE